MSERLRHIRDLLAQGSDLPPASCAWLVRAFDRLLEGEDDYRAVLELDYASRLAERDRLIRQAAADLPGDEWEKAKALHNQVKRYQSGLRAAPWVTQATRAARLPGTPHRIVQILRLN